jgi:AcrR family transcriptional regulator
MFKNEPKTRKSEETKRLVMEKALAIFLAKGFDRTTLRDLSRATGMSLGSFYYYFPSKESIILAFYDQNFATFQAAALEAIASSRKFEAQFEAVLAARIRTMEPEREIFLQLARAATDPKSPMSPFSQQTEAVREVSVGVFYDLLQRSDLKVPKAIAPYMPHLLWFTMMGVVLFWTFDNSQGQARTRQLIPLLAKNSARLLRALSLPIVGKHILPFKEILSLFPDLKPYAPKQTKDPNSNIGGSV